MKDEDIIPLLHKLPRPTFFTRDLHYYRRRLCHANYCLVWLGVKKSEAADYVRRVLRHRDFRTFGQRAGCVLGVSSSGITLWRRKAKGVERLSWED